MIVRQTVRGFTGPSGHGVDSYFSFKKVTKMLIKQESAEQVKYTIKIVKHKFTVVSGIGVSYAVIINGLPKHVFYSKDELNAFMRGLYGTG